MRESKTDRLTGTLRKQVLGMDELPRRAREEPEVKHGTGITDDIASGTTSWQDNHRRMRADSECAKRRRWPQICRDLQP